MKMDMPKSVYLRFAECLPELYPEIKVNLLACDEALQRLGFCEDAPCVVELDLSGKDLGKLMEELVQLEIDAYNGNDDPSPSDPYYQKYARYGWMWDWFYHAEENADD